MGMTIVGIQQTFVSEAITEAIYVRVVDTDQGRNEANVDAVRIDEIYLVTTS